MDSTAVNQGGGEHDKGPKQVDTNVVTCLDWDNDHYTSSEETEKVKKAAAKVAINKGIELAVKPPLDRDNESTALSKEGNDVNNQFKSNKVKGGQGLEYAIKMSLKTGNASTAVLSKDIGSFSQNGPLKFPSQNSDFQMTKENAPRPPTSKIMPGMVGAGPSDSSKQPIIKEVPDKHINDSEAPQESMERILEDSTNDITKSRSESIGESNQTTTTNQNHSGSDDDGEESQGDDNLVSEDHTTTYEAEYELKQGLSEPTKLYEPPPNKSYEEKDQYNQDESKAEEANSFYGSFLQPTGIEGIKISNIIDLPIKYQELWSQTNFPLKEIIKWHNAGFSPEGAKEWHDNNFTVRLASIWARAGFVPAHAQVFKQKSIKTDEARRWLDLNLDHKILGQLIDDGVNIIKAELAVKNNIPLNLIEDYIKANIDINRIPELFKEKIEPLTIAQFINFFSIMISP